MATPMLLKGGTVLVHDEQDHVHALKTDLLIEGNTISKTEDDILASSSTQIIDCTDKILTPGFIDTHHHVWQTLLKGRHGDDTLLDYFPKGNFTSSVHDSEDFFWGQLGGCLAMLDAGTTTVVDHAHLNYAPESSKAAIAADISSGIRSVFCYCPTPRTESWSPFKFSGHDMLPDWVMTTMKELASKAPFGDGRITLGLAFDALWMPKEVVVNLFTKAKDMGIKLITTHYVRSAIQAPHSPIEVLDSYGILDSAYLFSHTTNATPKDAALLLSSNSHASTTPSTELQMLGGSTAAFHPTLNMTSQCGVGVDCHSNNSVSIVSEIRLLLQHVRAVYNQKFVDKGVVAKKVNHTVEEAFNLGTIGGARAAGLSDKVGSLKVGKFADILVWDATSPAMVCAAQHDPVQAVVLQSSPKDIEMVIVDGVIRKEGGRLRDVDLRPGREMWGGDGAKGDVVSWNDVSKELVKRRESVQSVIEGLDMEEARKGIIQGWYINEEVIVDSA
ncbi:Metallo-dependent hydrolase [Mollisia scopiformis]|uniref:Metallo-dependent hydrolase n=1 Tax=Mollisia scopiformis TaxID=149040 RepID=A0A132B8U5_MOLSC|nr:Metallo-dependent hydrolase [Mollisia scopiformis]KUJ08673.1 Metallo-dependent hydrolase [Mollisia scopiformis]